MKINDFCILHLSDLHIEDRSDARKGGLPPRLTSLINDIGKQLATIPNILIVVSGDISSYGNIGKHKSAVINFFQKLKSAIPKSCSITGISIVPGNHDLKRPGYSPFLESDVKTASLLRPSDQDYLDVASSIAEIYDQPKVEAAFGIKIFPHNDIKICLAEVDTAWQYTNQDIERQLNDEFPNTNKNTLKRHKGEIEKFLSKGKNDYSVKQKDQLLDKYYQELENNGGNKFIIIAISHYPLTMLAKERKDGELFNNKSIDQINLWLCGHLHNAEVFYNFDNMRPMTMLMTGFGNSEQINDKLRYSIYKISPERNVCDIIIRATNDFFNFDNDYSIYKNAMTRQYGKFCCPLRPASTLGTFVHLNSTDNLAPKSIYVDETYLSNLRIVSDKISEFNKRMAISYDDHVAVCIDRLLDGGKVSLGTVNKYFSANGKITDSQRKKLESACKEVNTELKSLLISICETFIDVFSEDTSGITWRAHFRRYCGTVRDGEILNDEHECLVYCRRDSKPRKIPWKNGLIEAADKHENNMLTCSANNHLSSVETSWDDFITIIPRCFGNEKELKIRGERRPLLSFAVSVKGDDIQHSISATNLLYALEFFRFDEHITKLLDEYVKQLFINIEACIS